MTNNDIIGSRFNRINIAAFKIYNQNFNGVSSWLSKSPYYRIFSRYGYIWVRCKTTVYCINSIIWDDFFGF